MTTQPPPSDYYLNYFRQMLEVVFTRYEDILSAEDLAFLASINRCSTPSLRLLVRLYLRKGPNFLTEKLSYPEVADTDKAIDELCDLELIEKNPIVFAYELIELLPIARSRTLFSTDPKCRKADLIEAWFEDQDLNSCEQWGVEDSIVTPCHYESFRRFQLLYFSNERQGITDFILEDIGLFKYESYALEKSTRLFNNTDEIEAYLQLNDFSTEFYLMSDAKDWDELDELSHKVESLRLPEKLQNKRHRLVNRIAYRLEQLGLLERALELFQSNTLPPSRERQTRILFKQEQFPKAHELLKEIARAPKTADETQFYNRFINKVLKQLKKDGIKLEKPEVQITHQSWQRMDGTVEEQAVQYFGQSVWLENNLPNAVFGLIYWSAIFADVPGVWHHPFQAAPSDLTEPEFYQRRASAIEAISRKTKSQWREIICTHWQAKQDIRNPFVNWKHASLDWTLKCFDALTKDQWLGVFNHLLSDIRHHRSGFPDLFQKTETDYRFIEIKGPGDKLQDNQIHWLTQFQRLGIKAEVCHVQYLDD